MKIYAIVVTAILVCAIALAGLFVGLAYPHRMKLVAEFPSADGRPSQYQLWYGHFGDLELRSKDRDPTKPNLLYWDYYESVEVVSSAWVELDELAITMKDGAKVIFKVGAIDIQWPQDP